MSDYFDFDPEAFDPDDRDSGLFRDPIYDDMDIDPAQAVLNEVLATLGIQDFDEVIVNLPDADPSDLRGNRFPDLVGAILYLHDAGILRFSRVTLDDEEIGIEVDDDSGAVIRSR